MKKILVGATIAHAYRFAFGDFFKILGVIWLPLAIMWLPGLLLRQRMMALSAQMAARDFSGLLQLLPILVPVYLVAAVLMFMQVIGIAKLALGLQKGPGWYYFSLGKPLWRLIGSFLLLIMALIIGWLVIILGAALVGGLTAILAKFVSGPIFGLVTGILAAVAMIALWCGYFYSAIRLTFLLTPAIAAEVDGFAIARSWTLGLGNFWRMFAILLVIIIPYLVLELILVFGFMFKGVPFPTSQTADRATAFRAAMNARSMEMMTAAYHYWYLTYPAGIVLIVLFYGMAVGSQCFAYRALTDGEASTPVAGN